MVITICIARMLTTPPIGYIAVARDQDTVLAIVSILLCQAGKIAEGLVRPLLPAQCLTQSHAPFIYT